MNKQKSAKHRGLWVGIGLIVVVIIGGMIVLGPDSLNSGLTERQADQVSDQPAVPAAADLTPKPVAGHPAPDFSLQTLDGKTVNLSDFAGQPVIVNFWASWCGPCRLEMPHLQETYARQTEDKVVVLGVNLTKREPNFDEISAFIDEFGVTFPVVLDEAGDVARLYEVRGQPASVFIAPDGVINTVFYGPVTEDFINERVEEMVTG